MVLMGDYKTEISNLNADSLASVPLVVVSDLVQIMIGKCEDVNVYIINSQNRQLKLIIWVEFRDVMSECNNQLMPGIAGENENVKENGINNVLH